MAKEPKELEKLLGLHELLSPISLSVSSGTLSSIDGSGLPDKSIASSSSSSIATKNSDQNPSKSWHIQSTCAITGEGKYLYSFNYLLDNILSVKHVSLVGLHEGLDHLYGMIIRKRKMQKQKKKR